MKAPFPGLEACSLNPTLIELFWLGIYEGKM